MNKNIVFKFSTQSRTFFDPVKIGSIECKNRIFMAPMTRMRGDPATGIPNDLMRQYYEQRAEFGLIITECSQVSLRSNAFPGSGGIYTQEQVEGWKKITDSVHNNGGKIINQIWHCGRATHSKLTGNQIPYAPSPIAIQGTYPGLNLQYEIPKEMTVEDIKEVIQQFRIGAENALKAGFDGIELHGANGYLVDQFLRDGSNKRQDEYGGSVENRCRFPLEVIDQLISVFGKDRVGIRISPTGRYNQMFDSDPVTTYSYLLQKLQEKEIAFVELKEASDLTDLRNGDIIGGKEQIADLISTFKSFFKGSLIANDGFNYESGLKRIQNGEVDAISFGRLAISNPDLVNRFRNNYPLNLNIDFSKLYFGGESGYIDYPSYTQE